MSHYTISVTYRIGQEVPVVEEFVYLGSLVCSRTQSSSDISRCNAITRAAVQNLDNQIWMSKISISVKLKAEAV